MTNKCVENKYVDPEDVGYEVLEVLPFLKGKKLDQIAMSYIHSLRPSYVRISTGELKMNFSLWRVTVIIDEQNVIKYIEQEVKIGWIEPENRYHNV